MKPNDLFQDQRFSFQWDFRGYLVQFPPKAVLVGHSFAKKKKKSTDNCFLLCIAHILRVILNKQTNKPKGPGWRGIWKPDQLIELDKCA